MQGVQILQTSTAVSAVRAVAPLEGGKGAVGTRALPAVGAPSRPAGQSPWGMLRRLQAGLGLLPARQVRRAIG